MFDSGILHGIQDAGRWLQESLDEVMGTDLKVPDAQGNAHYDGIVGSGTRAALEAAVAAGKAKEINNQYVEKLIVYMQMLPEMKDNCGWIPRAQSFLMP